MLKSTLFSALNHGAKISLTLHSSRSLATKSKINLINSKSGAPAAETKPFFAVIATNPESKEKIKAGLINKGLICMDYTGDPNKIAVGFGITNFIELVEHVIEDVENNDKTDANDCYRFNPF